MPPVRISLQVSASPSSCRGPLVLLLILAAVSLLGCAGGQKVQPYTIATGGNPHRGRAVIADFKCGSCHTIPGIPGAHGVFGPPLNMMARRSYVAGNFPNSPDNLERWIMAPTAMKPKTAMPDLGLTRQQARDVTAYLETLR